MRSNEITFMSLILNIETATDICSIGVGKNGRLLAKTESDKPYEHASRITLLIEACCRQAGVTLPELDAIAVSSGPGSYTSLRVGASVAKGICYTLDKPLIAVSTLRSLAIASHLDSGDGSFLYCPMIDARRMEVYAAVYNQHGEEIESPEARLIDEASFQEYLELGKTMVFSGNGAAKCRPVIQSDRAIFRDELHCDADHLAPLAEEAYRNGDFENVAYFTPFYLKPPNITKPKRVL